MKRNIAFVFITLFIVMSSLTIYWTSERWWRKTEGVSISFNGEMKDGLSVYKSSTGEILIRLSEIASEGSDYIYYPDIKEVGVLSSSSQFIYLPWVAFCKDASPSVILLSDRVKVELDKNVIVTRDFFEFTSLDGGRTRVS